MVIVLLHLANTFLMRFSNYVLQHKTPIAIAMPLAVSPTDSLLSRPCGGLSVWHKGRELLHCKYIERVLCLKQLLHGNQNR